MSRQADEEILNIDTRLSFKDTGGLFQQNILVPTGLPVDTSLTLPLTNGTLGQFFSKGIGNSTGWENGNVTNFFSEFWILKEEQPSGTNGGIFTPAVWQTRNLNNLSKPSGTSNDVTLSSNRMTIQNGTYYIYSCAPAREIRKNKLKLRNITDGLDVLFGVSSSCRDVSTHSILQGIFSVAGGPKVYELQQFGSFSQLQTTEKGTASGFGVVEVYTTVFIQKLS